MFSSSLFLFLAFKAGFVRHDGHALIAASALPIVVLISRFLVASTYYNFVLVCAVGSWFFISNNYYQVSASNFVNRIGDTIVDAYDGIAIRLNDPEQLTNRYQLALEQIAGTASIPALQGTTDIYSFEQSYLLSTTNRWAPRPVFQSYSAYSPSLILANAAHLISSERPDNILFRVQPIDGRLPMLQDGASWPILFERYRAVSHTDNLIYFAERPYYPPIANSALVYDATHGLFEPVNLPPSNGVLLAEIDVRPTFLGRFLSLFYKPPNLSMTLEFEDGSSRSYRVVSGMMKTPFFITPLVDNNVQLSVLASNNLEYLSQDVRVNNITLLSQDPWGFFWRGEYSIKLYDYIRQHVDPMPEGFFLERVNRPVTSDELALERRCDGMIDILNNESAGETFVLQGDILSVSGWLVASIDEAIVPDDIFITLTSASSNTEHLFKTDRENRPDVAMHFQNAGLVGSGFRGVLDMKDLHGDFWMGLAYQHSRDFVMCSQIRQSIEIID